MTVNPLTSDQVMRIQSAAKAKLDQCSRVLVFDSQTVLYSTFEVDKAELPALTSAFGARDEAIRRGMVIQGVRYEVHRHHPPLVYGRTMSGDPETSTGAAICLTESGVTGRQVYSVITYELPSISARMVPMLVDFSKEYLQA